MKSLLNFFKPFCKQIYGPFLWTILTLVLLCLPGDSVPGKSLFKVPHLDKIAHIILFGGLVVSWGLYSFLRNRTSIKVMLWICAGSIFLGIAMEFVQVNFIPLRSFDGGDIVADIVGSVVGCYWVVRYS